MQHRLALVLAAVLTLGARADDITGAIRIWAAPTDAALLRAWGEGFQKLHPAAHVVVTAHGPESAMMGVYTGAADLSLLAREMRLMAEYMAFTWALRYPPTTIEVAGAGADTTRPHASLAVFVHENNPLSQLTLAQLDALYGAERRRGGAPVKTWGDLGLAGGWRDRPVRVLGPEIDAIPALFFRKAVLADSSKWNPALAEFPGDAALLAALAHDESAIAYAPLHGAPAGVKTLALAAEAGGAFVALTAETATSRAYPLARAVTMIVNRAPGAAVDPRTKAFLQFLLSPAGQSIVARDGVCLPLTAAQARAELKKIE